MNPQSHPSPDHTFSIHSEAEMVALGRDFAAHLLAADPPQAVFELIGDVGTGKTTFTRGLAEGLGIKEPVTSPSFTISKRYAFPLPQKRCKNYNTNTHSSDSADDSNNIETTPNAGQLVHYDFYRLDDPGIMRDELAEALAEPYSVIVVEWGGDVADLLPADKTRLEIALQEDGSRLVHVSGHTALPTDAAQTSEKEQNS